MRIVKKRCRKISKPQQAAMVEFMKRHPKLSSGKFDDNFQHQDARVLWQELTRLMDSISGPRKTWQQWRKAWHDLRQYINKSKEKGNNTMSGSSGLHIEMAPTEPSIVDPIALDHDFLESLSSRSSLKDFHFADVKNPEDESEQPECAPSVVKKPKTQSDIVKLAQDLMTKFNTQAKAEEDYRKTHLALIREQTEALKPIAKCLEALRK